MMNTYKYIKNENGVALMMVLLIATIGLAVMATMLYMIMVSTQSSGMQKRFATALDAGVGSESIITSYIESSGNISTKLDYINNLGLDVSLSDACVTDKLTKDTDAWDSACDKGRIIDVKDSSTYDMMFNLGNFSIFAKIIHTKAGNTASAGGGKTLASGGVVHVGSGGSGTSSGNIATSPIPFVYTIVAEARNKVIKAGVTEDQWRSARDKARIYILYEY